MYYDGCTNMSFSTGMYLQWPVSVKDINGEKKATAMLKMHVSISVKHNKRKPENLGVKLKTQSKINNTTAAKNKAVATKAETTKTYFSNKCRGKFRNTTASE